ncbi:SGNH/GDSL hydrolase family protein [Aureimonas phyllosphaerae]|uniref:Alpha-L-rhamnosidase n=1 Tax=Aureimonas phyllosphaerae TaxID=1166078 RepID=A0A7W6BZU4_9HYPH|nr:SGNH/GDSL hydrolase family protein [Aureimonas phyllosphaerae]MBB3936761.1 alpha-L-rhamnosidase [Aureimonas phyllosphaerae]MBB3960376.1 alpha-L-rhamnosidase [Aureimonas phyllosphaerae]SFF22220.1 PrsD/PrsE exporter outer membrane protein [Aureimonas phyllosphaerae]
MVRTFGSLLLVGCALVGAFPAAARDATLRISTFGTSLTANGGWQAPLAEAIGTCLRQPVEITNDGLAGAASDWGVAAVDAVAATRPDIVFLEFAVNDAALNKWIGVDESVGNMRAIVAAFRRRNPDILVYLMTMNPVSGRRSWARPFRDRYEDAHRRLAEEIGARYIDHRPGWEAMGADALYLAIVDGAHPTPGSATAVIVPNVMKRLVDDGVLPCATDRDR